MSFQTFCGKDPDDAVSYQKVLPQFLPSNAPSASTIRITQTGGTTIPAPTIQNESLYVIDTASPDATFTWTDIDKIDGFQPFGACPYVDSSAPNEVWYLVWGNQFISDNPPASAGAVYKWNVGQAPTLFLQTDNNARITTIFNGTHRTANGGKPIANDLFVVVGTFTTLNGTAYASGYVSFNSQTNALTAIAVAGLPDPTERPLTAIAVPIALGGGWIAAFQNPANFQKIAWFLGGNYTAISAGGTGVVANDKGIIQTLNFDVNNVLWIGGAFGAFEVGGATIANSAGIAAVSYSGGTTSFSVNVPLTNIVPLKSVAGANVSVFHITNTYDPADGIAVIGIFETELYKYAFLSPTDLTQQLIDITPPSLISPYGGHILIIDKNNWVIDEIGATLDGKDAGGAVIAFGYGTLTFDWYWDAPITTYPLSYVGFDNYQSGYGSWQIGTETSLNFAAANLRYCKSNGTSGNATSAVISSAYGSLFMIGDLTPTPPVWDLVATTGVIQFNP